MPFFDSILFYLNGNFLDFIDEFVAQFKSTILVLPNGTILATSSSFDANLYESEHSVTDEDLKKLLSESVKFVTEGEASKKKKKNKSKGKSANAGADGEKKTEADKENKKAVESVPAAASPVKKE